MRAHDLRGQHFGRLTALELAAPDARGSRWLCVCVCGSKVFVAQASLRRGATRSCGCLRADALARGRAATRTHGMTNSPTFKTWQCMRQRCENPNDDHYPNYGGRGLRVCDRWQLFTLFLADMGERPLGTTLDRIDVNGNYEPANCRWARDVEQHRNRRDNHAITIDGTTRSLAEWAERSSLPYHVLSQRIARGWAPERAVNTPAQRKKNRHGSDEKAAPIPAG